MQMRALVEKQTQLISKQKDKIENLERLILESPKTP